MSQAYANRIPMHSVVHLTYSSISTGSTQNFTRPLESYFPLLKLLDFSCLDASSSSSKPVPAAAARVFISLQLGSFDQSFCLRLLRIENLSSIKTVPICNLGGTFWRHGVKSRSPIRNLVRRRHQSKRTPKGSLARSVPIVPNCYRSSMTFMSSGRMFCPTGNKLSV